MHKTQVFLLPEGDHTGTRLTHTWRSPGSPGRSRGPWP
jgi:hypothetical protein